MFKSILALFFLLVPSLACADWYGSVDFMVPTRGVTDENVFQRNIFEVEVTLPTPPPDPLPPPIFQVGTDTLLSLDFDFVAGGRATVGFQTESYGVEGSWLVTDEWTAMASVSDPGGMLASPFTLPGSTPSAMFDNNTMASVAYHTKLESAELSLTHPVYYSNGEGVWKFGVRVLRLDEEFQYTSTNAVMTNTLLSNTDNLIIGPQIGFRGQTWAPGGAIALSASGFLGYNNINWTSDFNGTATTSNINEASLGGDASIEYLFAPHPNVFVRIGYQVLGIGSVGLAPNDPMINNNQTDGVVYSLPYFGVVVIR